MDKLELMKAQLKYSGLAEMPPDDLLLEELNAAARLINHRRNHMPVEQLPVPVEYESLWVRLAVSAVRKTGAEGQAGHSENGISRSYLTDGAYPRDLLRQIPWAVR